MVKKGVNLCNNPLPRLLAGDVKGTQKEEVGDGRTENPTPNLSLLREYRHKGTHSGSDTTLSTTESTSAIVSRKDNSSSGLSLYTTCNKITIVFYF
jgi:hypothetical protein